MPVDRTLWRDPPLKNSEHVRRKWYCPSCDSGSLYLKAVLCILQRHLRHEKIVPKKSRTRWMIFKNTTFKDC
jgi:hypothetical protein